MGNTSRRLQVEGETGRVFILPSPLPTVVFSFMAVGITSAEDACPGSRLEMHVPGPLVPGTPWLGHTLGALTSPPR